jgi:hypothetical protein
MHSPVLSKSARIRELNDHVRQTFTGGAIMVTASFEALSAETKARALEQVRKFNKFDSDNDPHHEHDMAFFEVDGERMFFKLDYYALDMRHGSDDPADPAKTQRVLTIGLAADY